ncbi:hypothetical protein HN803_05160 [candidate division WWE3 bacterium]|jgi:hypothetical protein|nr:hypothetical protein [candidate division WWE3 bacterium]
MKLSKSHSFKQKELAPGIYQKLTTIDTNKVNINFVFEDGDAVQNHGFSKGVTYGKDDLKDLLVEASNNHPFALEADSYRCSHAEKDFVSFYGIIPTPSLTKEAAKKVESILARLAHIK